MLAHSSLASWWHKHGISRRTTKQDTDEDNEPELQRHWFDDHVYAEPRREHRRGVEVFVENVQQEPGSGKSYTASGTTLTFDEAPPSGTGNIYVIYRGLAEVTTRLEHDANKLRCRRRSVTFRRRPDR